MHGNCLQIPPKLQTRFTIILDFDFLKLAKIGEILFEFVNRKEWMRSEEIRYLDS